LVKFARWDEKLLKVNFFPVGGSILDSFFLRKISISEETSLPEMLKKLVD
jgi:hypothetical protein